MSLNKVTGALDADYKEPSLEGVRWLAVGVTCASHPLLGLAQVRELPQKGGLGAVAYDPGQNPVPGQLLPPAFASD